VKAENRDEDLQEPGFYSKKQKIVETKEGSRCTDCRYWKRQRKERWDGQYLSNTFFRIYHALVSPKANL